jgi:hypothetical protein
VWSVSPFSWVRSARILINNGRRREVGNTGGTHSENPGFKPTSSRQLGIPNEFLRGFPPSAPTQTYKT